MRPVLEVHFVGKPGWVAVPGLVAFLIERPGYYARTRGEFVGPFENREAANRIAFLVTKRRLEPGIRPPKPFRRPRRVIQL